MLYTSAKPILKTALTDIAKEIKAESPADLELEQSEYLAPLHRKIV